MNLIEETMQAGAAVPANELPRVVATVDEAGAHDAIAAQLAALEEALAALTQRVEALEQGAAKQVSAAAASTRKTISAGAATLLTKSGLDEANSIEAGTSLAKIDSALTSLPIEQRMAVKAELMRAGLL